MTLLTSPPLALLLRTTLLLGLALLAVRLLHRRGPAVQTVAGRAALAAVALLLLTAPLTHFVPPLWHVPAAPRPAALAPRVTLTPTTLPPLETGSEGAKSERAGTSPAPTSLAPTSPSPNPSFRKDPAKQGGRSPTPPLLGAGGLLRLWATGTALLLLWLAVCQTHLTRLHRRAVPLNDGPAFDTLATLTPNPLRLLACPGIDGPFLAGVVRPAIYLPADHAETFSPDALRAVLAHELAHAERHDTHWTLASRLLCALLWFQPLLWLLCRRLDQLAEDACDHAVLAHACPPRVYADCLLTLAERRPQSRRTSPLTAGLVPFRSQLARRIQHILTVKGNSPMPAITCRLRLAIAAATILVALGGTLLIAAPKETNTDAIVGIWTGNFKPHAKYNSTAIFGPQGDLAIVGEQGRQVVYGHYAISTSSLTVTLKRTVDNGRTTINLAKPEPVTLPYTIADGVITVYPKHEPVQTGQRVSAYPDGMMIEDVAAQQVISTEVVPPQHTAPQSASTKNAKQGSINARTSPFYSPPSARIKPKMQTMIGYGLRFTTARTTEGKQTCSAYPNSPAARAGIPVTSWSKIIAVNSQPAPASGPELIRLMKSGPPLRLTLKTSVKPAHTYIINKKEAFSVPIFLPSSQADLLKSDERLRQISAGLSQGLETRRQSLARYNAQFQAEVRQALPGSDSQTQAKAINLERSIGGFNSSLKTIIKIGKQHPERKDTEKLVIARQRELKPLLAEEAQLFSATPQMQQSLSKIHMLAVQCHIREIDVWANEIELATINQAIANSY